MDMLCKIKMNNNLAPIILFVYNRPIHTKKTIEALLKNELSKESDIFIYSDGPKLEREKDVEKVRNYIKSVNGFKSITIVERNSNWGLADNIIDGVTTIVNRFGSVIVLEDDIVTSPVFLKFMNDALEIYKKEETVMHISGFLPNSSFSWLLPETFFLRFMSCWGWATWARAWKNFSPDAKTLYDELLRRNALYDYNLDGVLSFHDQLVQNIHGKIYTWATKWFTSIYLNNGLCLYPKQSMVQNIGMDGTGVHCGKVEMKNPYLPKLRNRPILLQWDNIKQSKIGRFYLKNFYRKLSKETWPTILSAGLKKIRHTARACKIWLCEKWGGAKKNSLPIEWMGNEYGGFYIYNDPSLSSNSIVYSLGIGEDASFDLAVIKKYGCKVYAFDPTPKSIQWVLKNKVELSSSFIFFDFGVAAFNGEAIFYPPENPDHVSCSIIKKEDTTEKAFSVSVKNIQTIMRELGHTSIDVLKMDIEGAEYEVIEDILAFKIPVNQLLVEFHHRFEGVGIEMTNTTIKKLQKDGFKIAAISSSGMEYTFVKEGGGV